MHGPADEALDLEADEAWALVRALAEDMDEEQMDDEGVSAGAGAAERLTQRLTDAERIELARLLQEQLRLAGAFGVGVMTASVRLFRIAAAIALTTAVCRRVALYARRSRPRLAVAAIANRCGRRSSSPCSTPTRSSRRRTRCS